MADINRTSLVAILPKVVYQSEFAQVEPVFLDGSVHVVATSDRSHVLEPVTFGPYHKQGDDEYGSDENQWLLRVKNGKWPEYGRAGDLLAGLLLRGTLVVPVPSSEKGKTNGVSKVAKHMARDHGMVDGAACLVRHTTVPKQHKNSGRRSRQTHIDSIAVSLSQRQLQKRILLLDDIFTSGTSMSACLELLLGAGAKDVTCATFARTV